MDSGEKTNLGWAVCHFWRAACDGNNNFFGGCSSDGSKAEKENH